MADTMLQHCKVWVNLCVYTQTKQYTFAIPQKRLNKNNDNLTYIALFTKAIQKRFRNTIATKQKINYIFYRQNNAINNDTI